MWSTYGSVASQKESGVHWSAQKHGDRTEEKKLLLQCLLSDLICSFLQEVLAAINTTELIVEIRPEKNSGSTGFEPMTSAIPVQALPIKPTRSWSLCRVQTNHSYENACKSMQETSN